MKKLAVVAVVAIFMASCGGGGEFGVVGKKFSSGKYKIYAGNEQKCIFEGAPGKYGYVLDGKIALPPVFDKMKLPETAKDGSVYFVVTKDGKMGLVKAFEKAYSVPCEYELVDIFVSPNLLVLKKKGESPVTLRLDTREKVTQ